MGWSCTGEVAAIDRCRLRQLHRQELVLEGLGWMVEEIMQGEGVICDCLTTLVFGHFATSMPRGIWSPRLGRKAAPNRAGVVGELREPDCSLSERWALSRTD